MEEKIKIYVPESINNILLKDMERFEFFKKDGSLNKNEFYNTLIVNYYEAYQKDNSEIFDHIQKTLKNNTKWDEFKTNDISYQILSFVETKTNKLDGPKSEVALSMKPTKNSSTVINYIQNYLVKYTTLSNYFRNLFASYSLLPQDRRERIIFKKNFEVLEEAIKTNRKVYFTTTNKDAPHVASPYTIANSKEELFNYLLADYNNLPFSFRVGRLRKLVILNEQSSFNKRNIPIFEKMIKFGPQFAYEVKEPEIEIKVLLTERGKEMYKSMYLHRPRYTKIDGDHYYFDCSRSQAYQYFSRFGRNAIIESPKTLTTDIHKFYAIANKAYNKLNKNEDKELSNW